MYSDKRRFVCLLSLFLFGISAAFFGGVNTYPYLQSTFVETRDPSNEGTEIWNGLTDAQTMVQYSSILEEKNIPFEKDINLYHHFIRFRIRPIDKHLFDYLIAQADGYVYHGKDSIPPDEMA